jgi:anaerobic ribonucleoside-triphosphate reductase activating protein
MKKKERTERTKRTGEKNMSSGSSLSSASSFLSLAAFLPRSRVNGPGVRAVVWVQGCPFRCKGCFNAGFQSFEGGTRTPVTELAARIVADNDTEGVTFSGGEPFAHAPALAELAERVRKARKSVVVFTGYPAAELRGSRRPDWRRLFAVADALLAGPFERDRPTRHPLLTSANQELVLLSDRYVADDFNRGPRRGEARIALDGTVTLTGLAV